MTIRLVSWNNFSSDHWLFIVFNSLAILLCSLTNSVCIMARLGCSLTLISPIRADFLFKTGWLPSFSQITLTKCAKSSEEEKSCDKVVCHVLRSGIPPPEDQEGVAQCTRAQCTVHSAPEDQEGVAQPASSESVRKCYRYLATWTPGHFLCVMSFHNVYKTNIQTLSKILHISDQSQSKWAVV